MPATLKLRKKKPFEVTKRRRHASVRMKSAVAALESKEALFAGLQRLHQTSGDLPEEAATAHSPAFVDLVMEIASSETNPETARDFAKEFLAKAPGS
jgi:hypothetical protein